MCDLCENPRSLGATKLNKILWYTDTLAFRHFEKSVSGESAYVKRQFGPVPKNIIATLEKLQDEGKIHVRKTKYFGHPKQEFHVLESPNKDIFSEDERSIISRVVATICNSYTAESISDLSHDLIWEAAKLGEDIPIKAVLAARADPPTKKDMRWADALIKKYQPKAA